MLVVLWQTVIDVLDGVVEGCRTVTFLSNDSRKTSSSMHVLMTSSSSVRLISMVSAFLAITV